MIATFIKKLIPSLFSNDIIIAVAALATLVVFWGTLRGARDIEKRISEWKVNRNVSFSKYLNSGVNVLYTLFITLISIFPLLGMLGTVMALLGLDLSAGDMTNIKNNFFDALTSTAWGVIFSVVFKVVHAFKATYIEDQIEECRKVSEEIEAEKLAGRE